MANCAAFCPEEEQSRLSRFCHQNHFFGEITATTPQRFPATSCLLDRTVPHRTATSRTRLPSPSEQHAYRQVTNVGEQEQGHRPLLRVSYCSDHGVLYHASVHRYVGVCRLLCCQQARESRRCSSGLPASTVSTLAVSLVSIERSNGCVR